jgi:hemerythrin-like domain-containing protein
MLHQIGARSASSDLLASLRACHSRIREHIALATRLATETGHPREEIRDVALQVKRYFTVAFPLHVEDEELTIAPRLARLGSEVGVALATVAGEHDAHRPMIEWMVSVMERIAAEPEHLARMQGVLGQTLSVLMPLLDVHLEIEERVVFPALLRLEASERADIVAAMRARRGDYAPG